MEGLFPEDSGLNRKIAGLNRKIVRDHEAVQALIRDIEAYKQAKLAEEVMQERMDAFAEQVIDLDAVEMSDVDSSSEEEEAELLPLPVQAEVQEPRGACRERFGCDIL